ncbi:Uncharacterised protein [Vibrio cholerae]|nr:Uncharacterised protein [Vibrio cholerae]
MDPKYPFRSCHRTRPLPRCNRSYLRLHAHCWQPLILRHPRFSRFDAVALPSHVVRHGYPRFALRCHPPEKRV